MKLPKLSGKMFSYLGHFRQPKHLARGHNVDLTLEELERLSQKMEEEAVREGRRAEKVAPAPKLAPAPEKQKSDLERLEERIELEKQFGIRRGLDPTKHKKGG